MLEWKDDPRQAIKKGKKVLFYPLIFFVRRIVLVYLVVAGTKELIYQMMILMGSTIISACVVHSSETFESSGERRLTAFSEIIILLVTYSFFSFDLLDVEANFEVGYFPIGVMGLFLLISLLIMIIGGFRATKLKIRICCAKRYHKKQRKFLQGTLKMKHALTKLRMEN